jgi:hypothetical protein
MSGPAIRFRTIALMTLIVCLLDALTTTYALHFVRSDKYVVYERGVVSGEIVRHVFHLGPLATFAILMIYTPAVFTAFYFVLYKLLSSSLGIVLPVLESRLERKPPRILMPDALVAMLVIMQGAVVVTNNLEVILSVLLE